MQVAQHQGHPTNTFAAEHVSLLFVVWKRDAYSWLPPKQEELLSRGHLSRINLDWLFAIRMVDDASFQEN